MFCNTKARIAIFLLLLLASLATIYFVFAHSKQSEEERVIDSVLHSPLDSLPEPPHKFDECVKENARLFHLEKTAVNVSEEVKHFITAVNSGLDGLVHMDEEMKSITRRIDDMQARRYILRLSYPNIKESSLKIYKVDALHLKQDVERVFNGKKEKINRLADHYKAMEQDVQAELNEMHPSVKELIECATGPLSIATMTTTATPLSSRMRRPMRTHIVAV